MPFEFRDVKTFAVAFAAILMVASASAEAGRAHGVPKSAPAFAKFVANMIETALPSARVSIAGRLRLDVEAPNGRHTTDLHNIYSVCQRDPGGCEADVTTFVVQVIYSYKATNKGPSRGDLRIVVRPSAYVAALRVDPRRNRPVAEPLAGDYWMIAVADRPTSIMMLDENDLAGLNLSAKSAFALGMLNTRNVLQQSLKKELAGGNCRGILGGDIYTASTVAFVDLWGPVSHRCHNNLLIAIPASDVVLFADGTERDVVKSITRMADQIAAKEEKPFPPAVLRWSKSGWVAVTE